MGKHDKWWLRPVRMMRRDYVAQFEEFMNSDLDALAREDKERWHANCEWVMATPGCAPGRAHLTLFNSDKFEKLPALGDFDTLRAYLPHAKKYGVHLVPYLNMHWYSYEWAAKHPGWEQVLEDGTPYGRKTPLYGNGTTMCVNSPWRDWAFEMIREVMRTGVDGCFLDGPVVFNEACYCKHCKKLFAKRTGRKRLPAYGDWTDPLWKEFLQFRADSWAYFMRDAQAAAREINPDAVIFLNGGNFSSRAPDLARDPYRLEKFQTFTGAEQFFHCHETYNPPYRSLNLARFLSAGDKPAVVFTHHALSTWHYNPLPPAEMTTALAQSVAGGANTWFAIFMHSLRFHERESFEGVEAIQGFFEKHEDYYTAARPAAETAVLLSNRTLYYYITRHGELCHDIGGGREENLTVDAGKGAKAKDIANRRAVSAAILDQEYPGCLDAFNYAHIPARVLWDEHLTPEKLKGVRTIVLPNAACLSNKQVAAIQRFVEAGGGLVATFESGLYDEWGEPKPRRAWLRFLGIERVEGVFVPSRTEDYLTITTAELKGFDEGTLAPRPVNALKVGPTSDAKVLALYNEPLSKSYLPLKGVTDYPAILLAKRGKGRVIYVASALFESFNRFRMDRHKSLARALVRLAAGRTGLQVETDAPGSLAVEIRSQKGRLLVHLVNVTSDMKRPMGAIIPLRDVSVSVRARGVRRVRCLRARRNLRFQSKAGRLTFRVPRIDAYELVILEKAGGRK